MGKKHASQYVNFGWLHPCLGDFALFGYGVSHPDKDEPASDQNFREA